VTRTETATLTQIRSASATATPSPAILGDANCDRGVGAADLPALVKAIASTEPESTCGADTDQNGDIDEGDVPIAIELIFTQ
jgi:hypothetical protein